MLKAASTGNVSQVRDLLRRGTPVNDTLDFEGRTALCVAVDEGHLELLRLLLEHNANVNQMAWFGHTPLFMAAVNGDVEVVKLLLQHKANIHQESYKGGTALHVATSGGHLEIVSLLLEHQANVNHQNGSKETPLHIAADYGRLEILTLLLEKKAKVDLSNSETETPLYMAASRGHLEVVKKLLEFKANANKRKNTGATPLHIAAARGHVEVVTQLLAHHANVNKGKHSGERPLHLAASGGHTETVSLLLQHGAHVNKADNDGFTALHLAAQRGHSNVVRILLEHNANVTRPNLCSGWTPVFFAAFFDYPEILKQLARRAPEAIFHANEDDEIPIKFILDNHRYFLDWIRQEKQAKGSCLVSVKYLTRENWIKADVLDCWDLLVALLWYYRFGAEREDGPPQLNETRNLTDNAFEIQYEWMVHTCCALMSVDSTLSLIVIRMFRPEVAQVVDEATGGTPLLAALKSLQSLKRIDYARESSILALVDWSPAACRIRDTKHHCLPLEFAVEANLSCRVIDRMIKAYPAALEEQGASGLYLFEMAAIHGCELSVVFSLISPDILIQCVKRS